MPVRRSSRIIELSSKSRTRAASRAIELHIIILTQRLLLTMARFLFPVGLLVVQAFANDGECVS
jgi:hypothetical protein